MHRAVLTLLVGLMLSLGGGANALTFKSDGTVVQSEGHLANSSNRSAEVPDLSKYDEFRVIVFDVAGREYSSHTAFSQGKTLFGFKAKGVFVYEDEFCEWQSVIRNSKTKTGSFKAKCPSGAKVDGEFTFVGNRSGSYGAGIDNSGQKVSYSLKGRGSSSKAKVRKFFKETKSFDDARRFYTNTTDKNVCSATKASDFAKLEARRRGLNCEVDELAATQVASASSTSHSSRVSGLSNKTICDAATANGSWETRPNYVPHVNEALRRGLTCGVGDPIPTTAATNAASDAELLAAQNRAAELERQLALIQAREELTQRKTASDNQAPEIAIGSVNTVGKQGLIKGRVSDNTGVAEVTVDGNFVPVSNTGSFEYRTFVPVNGISVEVQATDFAGLTSIMSVSLERSASPTTAAITFERLNPLGKQVAANSNALALIVGVADYENTPAKAIFADSDALMFRDYASEKLGIPENRIKTLVDDGADERQLLLSVKNWLSRAVKQNQSDVYVFFAGHGLASDDGEKMYLLPHDGAPELLEDTAVSRDRLFSDIAQANPRSVTVFLDTCYSGTTRGPDMLIASRPIAIRAKEQAVPGGFTVMTAAAGDQTAKPLEEAKHGMFSYFLMKGMEGDADANSDNEITAGELHAFVQQNVIQQSSGSQTPELQGDADRVLVRFD